MKFNDGFWLLKHEIKAFYGLQVVKARSISRALFFIHRVRRLDRHTRWLTRPSSSDKAHQVDNAGCGAFHAELMIS
jgi:hypothetical protein